MDPRLEANRANWDDRVGIHTKSSFYGVEKWLANPSGPRFNELEALGDVRGLSLVHLQCHFGQDTLDWARVGAEVTGIDFSPAAIAAATDLAMKAGLAENSRFICANVYDAPEALAGKLFDIVYVSLGALNWLPDVNAWGSVVGRLLKPGGRLFINDVHPMGATLDDAGERIEFSYFEESENPLVFNEDTTYTDGPKLKSTLTYEWIHSMSEIIGALLEAGLILDQFDEYDWTVFQQFDWLVEEDDGRFVTPPGRPSIGLTFTIQAHRSL